MNLKEFQAWCRFLDVRNAQKQQYIFTTEEQFDKDFDFMKFGSETIPLTYSWEEKNEVQSIPCIGHISFCGFDFVFIDPSKLPQQTVNQKSING